MAACRSTNQSITAYSSFGSTVPRSSICPSVETAVSGVRAQAVATPAWRNNAWTASSYRAVDEWEHLLFFHRPSPFVYDRRRLKHDEWAEWGSRGIWKIPSVRRNDDDAPRFPDELAARIVRMLTEPGQLVLDPFVGTGTTHRGRAPARTPLDRHRQQSRPRRSCAGPHAERVSRPRGARARGRRRRPHGALTNTSHRRHRSRPARRNPDDPAAPLAEDLSTFDGPPRTKLLSTSPARPATRTRPSSGSLSTTTGNAQCSR